MPTLDDTRPDNRAAHAHADELPPDGDPLECPACVAVGETCHYHRGWAAGWDACTALMAHDVAERRAAELDPANWTPWLDDEHDGEPAFCVGCGGHGTIPCSWCDGSQGDPGGWSDDDVCSACDGSGDEPCPDCTGSDWGTP